MHELGGELVNTSGLFSKLSTAAFIKYRMVSWLLQYTAGYRNVQVEIDVEFALRAFAFGIPRASR